MLMDKNDKVTTKNDKVTSEDFHKILKLHKIKIYEQQILIGQLKNKLFEEEQINNYYIKKINIISKL